MREAYSSERWEPLGLELNMQANGKVSCFSECPEHCQATLVSLFSVSEMCHGNNRQNTIHVFWENSLPPESCLIYVSTPQHPNPQITPNKSRASEML